MIRAFFAILFITSLLLGYVFQKVNLVKLSYEIDKKEKLYSQFSEEQKQLKFKVAFLKSPGRLEEMMKSANVDFQLPREIRIVKIDAPLLSSGNIVSPSSIESYGGWLNWIKEAQAKTTK